MYMNPNNPRLPDVKENVKTYWNERSSTFDDDIGHGTDETECRLWKHYLTGIIGPEPRKILDVGTGTGVIAIILAELGHEVIGIDLGKKMLDVGRKKTQIRGLRIAFMAGDAENPPFADNTFDCVICRHLLWTLPHPNAAISEWTRVCRPKGVIIAIDGHTKPFDYFPDIDDKQDESQNGWKNLWNRMYTRKVIQQLPLKDSMDVDSLKSFFLNHHLSGVQHKFIEEISDYQISRITGEHHRNDHGEVNIIWGTVE